MPPSAPYSYSWFGSLSSGSSVTNLCEGIQPFEATDALGCTIRDTAIIEAADTLFIQMNPFNATCWDVCDGKLDLTITGGMAPFQYLWSNGSKSDSTSYVFQNIANENVYVDVTDSNVCTERQDMNVSVEDCSIPSGEIELNHELSIQVYPNPVLTHLILSFQQASTTASQIYIYNELGNIVWHANLPEVKEKFIIDFQKMPRGMYFIKLESGDRFITKVFVKA